MKSKTPLEKPGGVFLFWEKTALLSLPSLVLLLRGFGWFVSGLVLLAT